MTVDNSFLGIDKGNGAARTSVTVQYTDQHGRTTTATQPADGLSPAEMLDLQRRMTAELQRAADARARSK